MMKKLIYIFTLSAAALLSACGGGGSTGPSTPPSVVVAPPPASAPIAKPLTNPLTNPLTGGVAPGTATTTLSGMTNPYGVVTAYLVNPDGSSSTVLSAPTTSDLGGVFTLTLSSAPTSWVRLVSRGGKIVRREDNSHHPVESMALTAPFVTTAYNHLQISPVSDIASHIMAYKAKTGSTLVDAFKFGMARTLQLDVANLALEDDTSVYLNVLKGSIATDKGYSQFQSLTMGELLMGIERFGIMYDLPQNQVWRVLAAAGENSYPLAAIDGAGAAVNVGAWVNGSFDTTVPISLKTLMSAKTLDEIKVADSGGTRVAPKVSDMISRYIILEGMVSYACQNGVKGAFTDRYPFYPLDVKGQIPAAACTDVARRMADFQARMLANSSRNLK